MTRLIQYQRSMETEFKNFGLLFFIEYHFTANKIHMSRRMGKPTICIDENKGADQLCSNCEADQCLCFRNTDSSISLLSKSKISGL